MARLEIPLPRRHGQAKSKFVSSQTLVNAMLEQDAETGEYALYGAPGLSLFKDIGVAAPVRGVHDFNGVLLAVVGETLYTVTGAGVATARGTIAGIDAVIISNNGNEAAIVSDAASYAWNGTTLSLSTITDPDFQQANSVDFLDQYLIFTKANSGQFFLSDLASATSYDALDVATAESRPDALLRIIVQNREALLFGTRTMEDWYNAGDADFPLVRGQTYCEVGIIGKYAAAIIDNSVAWLASDKTVRVLRAGSPQIVSDAAISSEIEGWADASLTRAMTYTVRGHQVLVLRNPDGCLIWDASMPAQIAWSARKSQDSDTWRVGCMETMPAGSEWNGRIICGDASTGKLYTLDVDANHENDAELTMELVSRTMGPGGQPFTLDSLEVMVEPGVSTPTGQGSNAIVWAQFSRDGGNTFGARLERSLGATGIAPKTIRWDGLGQFPARGGVFKLGISDPVSRALTSAYAEVQADAP